MNIKLHKQATTTPKIRAEIQAAPSSITDAELARQYSVATATIRRWRYRDDVYDRPHTRHNLLETAYNDAAGVTAAFNLNLLERLVMNLTPRSTLGICSSGVLQRRVVTN